MAGQRTLTRAKNKTTDGPEPDYRDHNAKLFGERRELKAKIVRLEKLTGKRLTPAKKAELRRAVRQLDELTEEIVRFNYGLVRSYVKKFTSNTSREDSADFEAAAVVGLMRAIDSYDESRGRFGQWAFKPIQREVLRAVRDADYPNLNPGDFEKRPSIMDAVKRLQAGDEDYHPTHAEVSVEAGCTVEQVGRVLDAPRLDSLSTPVGTMEGDTTLGDLIPSRDTDTETRVLSSLAVEALDEFGLSSLDPRELLVLVRRYGLDCEPEQKLAGIGEMLGLSREAVRQVESKALARIQHPTNLRKLQRQGRR